MSWQGVLFAMLPEHVLLAGIVVLIIADVTTRRPRGALAISLAAQTTGAPR